MNRLAAIALALLLLPLASAAGPAADLLTPGERAWLAAHPRIVLGVGAEWPPDLIQVGEGRIAGFALDYLRLLGAKLGIEIGLEAGPWHAMVAAALAWLAKSTERRWGIRMSYAAGPNLPPLGREASVILFQCARELVYNLIKHARARRGAIQLRVQDGWLELIVEDDGIGLDPKVPHPPERPGSGFGLHSVRERLALIDADLHIESGTASGAPGTRVRIRLPADRVE